MRYINRHYLSIYLSIYLSKPNVTPGSDRLYVIRPENGSGCIQQLTGPTRGS